MVWYKFHIGKEMADKWSSNKNTDSTLRKEKRQVLCKFFTKIIIFELYVSLPNIYFLLCIMQSQKMMNLDKIISDLRLEEHKILMEKLQKVE